jgi:Domain of unknown function (DUF4350)
MLVSLDPGDRKLLIVSGALLVGIALLAFILSPSSATQSPDYPSSYAVGEGGAEAAYLLVDELRYRVERWTRPPSELPKEPRGTVLVLADPFVTPTAGERSAIREFVRQGGRVLATGGNGAMLWSSRRLASTRQPAFEPQKFSRELPAPLTRHAQEIVMQTDIRWGPLLVGQQRYYGDREGATVLGFRIGEGEVIWWADSMPLTNYGLKQSSNLMLFLNSLDPGGEPPENTRVLWDEYFHGQRRGLWSYAASTPAPWGLVQLAVVAGAALFTFARRSGPMRPLQAPSRLSPLEFIDTLGALYQRKGAAREALSTAYNRFRSLLLPRLGLPSSASPDDISRGVRERLGWTVPGFWETLQRCELGVKASHFDDAQALHLIQELHDYARRFRLAGYFGF